ncbi:hypothetical protein C5167_013228, partial [Papaver somniferum]
MPVYCVEIDVRDGDEVHLSSEGSNAVVEEILKVLKEAGWNPSLHWKFLSTEFGECSCPTFFVAPHPTGLGPHVPLPEYIKKMLKIVLHLKSLSDKTRVIYLSPPPMNDEIF